MPGNSLNNFVERAAGHIFVPSNPYLTTGPSAPPSYALSTLANQQYAPLTGGLSQSSNRGFQMDKRPPPMIGQGIPLSEQAPPGAVDIRTQYVEYLKKNKVKDEEIQDIIAALYNNQTDVKPSYNDEKGSGLKARRPGEY